MASLEVILNEGLATETRHRIKVPLARPGENQTLAEITIGPGGAGHKIYAPLEDPAHLRPHAKKKN